MGWDYQHAVEIEVYVEQGDAARDVAFDDLLQAIGAVLELDTSLGGLAFGLTYGRPEPAMRLSLGAGDQERDTLGDRRLRDQRSLSPEHCFFLGEEISMARAHGSSAHRLMKRETTYGQAATGNYIRIPFNRCNLGSEHGLIDDPVLGERARCRMTLLAVVDPV